MACVCHSSAGGQGQIQQKNLVTGLYPSLQDRRTRSDTATSDSSISIPTGVPTSKNEEPFLQPLCKKPCSKRLHSLSQTDVMVKDELFVPELFFSCPEQRCLQHHPQHPHPHLPSTAAFSQAECWTQHTRLLSRHTAPPQTRRIHPSWRRPQSDLKKGTLDSQCSGEATGTTSPTTYFQQ